MRYGYGYGLNLSRRRGGTTGIIPVVTTSAQTVTFERLDIIDDATLTIDWGDNSSDTYTHIDNGSTKTHAYAGAGTYQVKVSDARVLKEVNLNNALIVGFNSSFYLSCGDNLESITHQASLVNPVINTSDMSHLKLSHTLYLHFSQPGTYTINSDHLKAYTLSHTLYLFFNRLGTYNINSDHFKTYTLSTTLYMRFTQSGTYTINSDNFKAYTLSTTLYLWFTQSGTYTINSDHLKAFTLSSTLYLYFLQSGTYNIARADITFLGVVTVVINIPSLATDTDYILLGFYDRLTGKTNNGGTINLTGCPEPSGVYEANADCGTDPNGGKGAAYELIHDSCGRAIAPARQWASVTVQGGGTP